MTAGLIITDGHALHIDHRGAIRDAREDRIMLPLGSGRIKPGCPPTVQARTWGDPTWRPFTLAEIARRLA